MQPPTLSFIAKTNIIRVLACTKDGCKDNGMLLEHFRHDRKTFLSEEILSALIRDFPNELTDGMLTALAPPHLRHFKLTKCTKVSCEGLSKIIRKCSHLKLLDLSECNYLLHPTIFCSLKDNAPNLTHLSLEDCEVVTDDVVQIILMCCPSLEHLNLSSCKNITDAAFVMYNNSYTVADDTTSQQPSKRMLEAAAHLNSIDISGCGTLTSTAIRHLVGLCCSRLRVVNMAWTAAGCTALLYLAGLSLEAAVSFIQTADPDCAEVLNVGSSQKMSDCELEMTEKASEQNLENHHQHVTADVSCESSEEIKTTDDMVVQLDDEDNSERDFGILESSGDISDDLFQKGKQHSKDEIQGSHSCQGKSTGAELQLDAVGAIHKKQNNLCFIPHNNEPIPASDSCNSYKISTDLLDVSSCNSSQSEVLSNTDIEKKTPKTLAKEAEFGDEFLSQLKDFGNWSDTQMTGSSSNVFGDAIVCLSNALGDLLSSEEEDETSNELEFPSESAATMNDLAGSSSELADVSSIKGDNVSEEDEIDVLKAKADDITTASVVGNYLFDRHANIPHAASNVLPSMTSDLNKNVSVNGHEDVTHLANIPGDGPSGIATLPCVHGDASAKEKGEDVNKEQCEQICKSSGIVNIDDTQVSCPLPDVSKTEGEANAANGQSYIFDEEEHLGQQKGESMCTSEQREESSIALQIDKHGAENDDCVEEDEILFQLEDLGDLWCDEVGEETMSLFTGAIANLTSALGDLVSTDGNLDDALGDNSGNDDEDGVPGAVDDGDDGDDVGCDDDLDARKRKRGAGTSINTLHCGELATNGANNTFDVKEQHLGSKQQNLQNALENTDNDTIQYQHSGAETSELESLIPSTDEHKSVGSNNEQVLAIDNVTSDRICEEELGDDFVILNSVSTERVHLDVRCEESDSPEPDNSCPASQKQQESEPREIIPGPDGYTLQFVPHIVSLDISNIYFHSRALGTACLRMFARANKTLERFSASWSQFDDDTLLEILKNEPQLRSLTLVDCECLSNKSIMRIPSLCPLITSIDLKGVTYVTDPGIIPLVRGPALQTLSFAEVAISDCSLNALASAANDRLLDLDLSWCEDITDRGICTVASHCSNLRSLSLRQCSASAVAMETLAMSCHAMTSLNISGVNQLTDSMVTSLASHMPLLVEVDLSWNASLTDVGVSSLLSNCGRLREAMLSGLKMLTSKPFLPIIGDLPRWRRLLEMLAVRRVRDQREEMGLVQYLKPCDTDTAKLSSTDLPFRSMTYCPDLMNIVLEYSDKVNDDHLAQIVAVCRRTLNIVDYYGQPIEPKWILL